MFYDKTDSNDKLIIKKIRNICQQHLDTKTDKVMLSDEWKDLLNEYNGWFVIFCFSRRNRNKCIFFPALVTRNDAISLANTKTNFQEMKLCTDVLENNKVFNNEDITHVPILSFKKCKSYLKNRRPYIELNPTVVHDLDLHNTCTFDELEEEVSNLKIIYDKETTLVLIRSDILNSLLEQKRYSLLRYFSVERKANDWFETYGSNTKQDNSFNIYKDTKNIKVNRFISRVKEKIIATRFYGLEAKHYVTT